MIKSATKDEFGAPCLDGENIILFLTDGAPTVGEQTTSGLKEIIDDFGLNITLFSYALGRNIDTDILK